MEFHKVKEHLLQEPQHWLVSGAAGFIGSNLVEALLKLGQTVTGLDNFSAGRQINLDQVRECVSAEQWNRFRFIEGDIEDLEVCQEACDRVAFVLHHAALGSVPGSVENPLKANASNVTGFLNMLVASRDSGVRRVVYAASSATYGDSTGLPKTEGNIGRQLSPYALTKYVNELYADVFGRCYGTGSVGLRYFNVFGSRQDPDGPYAAVIPKWVCALLNNQKVRIFGDGETSRDFCYIENVVQANLLAASTTNPKALNQVFNVATGTRTSLNQLFGCLKDALNGRLSDPEKIRPQYAEFRTGDVRHSQADIQKAGGLLGYVPSHTIEDGLRETIQWYCDNLRDGQ